MWPFYALINALATSIHIPLIKKISQDISSIPYIFIANLFIIPVMLASTYFLGGFPAVTPEFYWFTLISSIADTAALVLAVNAFKVGALSLITPLSAFGPLITTIGAFIFLGEVPDAIKISGVILIIFGVYFLNIADIKKGFFEPFKVLAREKGVSAFLIAQVLWAIAPIFQKRALFETNPQSPEFIATVGTILISVYLLPYILFVKRSPIIGSSKKYFWIFVLIAIIVTIQQFAKQLGFQETNPGYVVAVMKLSIILTLIWGSIFFGEKRLMERLFGGVIMIAGALLLIF